MITDTPATRFKYDFYIYESLKYVNPSKISYLKIGLQSIISLIHAVRVTKKS